MKKMMVLFWTLLLFPTLALASGDMVSISELRQQVEAMGRWAKTYEAYGRTIEVDVPIICAGSGKNAYRDDRTMATL